jgi:hypothetical protein
LCVGGKPFKIRPIYPYFSGKKSIYCFYEKQSRHAKKALMLIFGAVVILVQTVVGCIKPNVGSHVTLSDDKWRAYANADT